MQVEQSKSKPIPTARISLDIRIKNAQKNATGAGLQELLTRFYNGDGVYGSPPVSPVVSKIESNDVSLSSPSATSVSYGHGYGQTGVQFHSPEYTDAVNIVKLSSEQLNEKLTSYITDKNISGIVHHIKILHHHYQNPQFTGDKNNLITQIQNHFNTLTSSSTGQ